MTQGPRQQEMHGQCVLAWNVDTPQDQRDAVRRKLLSLRHTRSYRVSHRQARTQWERDGLAAILRTCTNDLHRPHMLRLYYHSMGGEILCCETVHSGAEASRLHYQYRGTPSYRDGFYVGSAAVDAEIWPIAEDAPRIGYGARLVVLPAQVSIVEVVDPEESGDTMSMLAAAA